MNRQNGTIAIKDAVQFISYIQAIFGCGRSKCILIIKLIA
jgi:hypothetical protein